MNEKNQHLPSLVNFPLNLATIFILWQQKMATKEANQPMITTWLYTFLLEYNKRLSCSCFTAPPPPKYDHIEWPYKGAELLFGGGGGT